MRPFLALRSYLPADHPDKAKEMGSEPTPGAFIDALLDVTEECRRVLAPHGSLVFELGDTYAGSGGAGGDYGEGGWRVGQDHYAGSSKVARTHKPEVGPPIRGFPERKQGGGPGWPLDKSLTLIPEIYRFALVYGFNPLTGRTTERWRARNVIRWCRPNPPVGALGDKVRPATSDMVVACVGRKRYFDLDAVRTELARNYEGEHRGGRKAASTPVGGGYNHLPGSTAITTNPAGAPPLDHWWYDDTFDQDAWLQSTEGFPGSHYATWPRDLLVKPILAMCPQRVCRVCGCASERITENSADYDAYRKQWVSGITEGKGAHSLTAGRDAGTPAELRSGGRGGITAQKETLGWTDCGCIGVNRWRPGLVLDPFAGSGTTLAVATGHGRDAIGIDLDKRNAELARQRVGMFLTIDERTVA